MRIVELLVAAASVAAHCQLVLCVPDEWSDLLVGFECGIVAACGVALTVLLALEEDDSHVPRFQVDSRRI